MTGAVIPGGAKQRELCAAVRQLLLTMCPEPRELGADALHVVLRRSAVAGMYYLRVRQLLAHLGEDIPPTPERRQKERRQSLPELRELVTERKRKEHLKAELHRAARYLKGDTHG